MIPKIKDFMPYVKTIVTVQNPIAGAVLGIAEKLIFKPKRKVETMMSGKKTYIGIVIAMVPVIAGLFGYDVNSGWSEEATLAMDEIIVLVGGLIAAYGRTKAVVSGGFVKK